MKIYIGWDALDLDAYRVAESSIRRHASREVEIVPVTDHLARAAGIYWRGYYVDPTGQKWDERDGKPFSTAFTYPRFLVPYLENYSDEVVLFVDADMMFRRDVAELFDLWDDQYSVMCVKHEHVPPEGRKALGIQQNYRRKNWASVFLCKPSACRPLTLYDVNNKSRDFLMQMRWVAQGKIGEIPEAWNWLCGWSSPDINPANVHYTRGTPDMAGYEGEPYADEWRAIFEGLNG